MLTDSTPTRFTAWSHFDDVKSSSTLASRANCLDSRSLKLPCSGTISFRATGCPPFTVLARITHPKAPLPSTSSAT